MRGKEGNTAGSLIDVTACEVVAEWRNSDIIYIYCIGYIYTYMKINRFSYIKKFFLQFSYENVNVRSCPNARGNFGHPYNSL